MGGTLSSCVTSNDSNAKDLRPNNNFNEIGDDFLPTSQNSTSPTRLSPAGVTDDDVTATQGQGQGLATSNPQRRHGGKGNNGTEVKDLHENRASVIHTSSIPEVDLGRRHNGKSKSPTNYSNPTYEDRRHSSPFVMPPVPLPNQKTGVTTSANQKTGVTTSANQKTGVTTSANGKPFHLPNGTEARNGKSPAGAKVKMKDSPPFSRGKEALALTAANQKTGLTNSTNQKTAVANSAYSANRGSAFQLEGASGCGLYQNVQPVALNLKKSLTPPALPSKAQGPLPKKVSVEQQRKQEKQQDTGGRELDGLYAKVQKSRPIISNEGSSQLKYVEVEFPPPSLPSRDGDTTNTSNNNNSNNNWNITNNSSNSSNSNKKRQPQTTYTDVIHKDGQLILITPN